MDACARSQRGQTRAKLSVKKENISEGLLSCMKLLLQSRKELCSITERLKSANKDHFIEITFLGISGDWGSIQGVADFYMDVPELTQSLLCNLHENEVILMKDGKEATKSSSTQNVVSGTVCMMKSTPFLLFKSDSLFILLSKYSSGVKYAIDQDCNARSKKNDNEEDDTNQSVSSIEDDFVTAFEHLDEEESVNTDRKQGFSWGSSTSQRDAASQTQPVHCLDIEASKIIFGSVRRRSSIKSTVLMGFMGLPDISSSKNTVTTFSSDTWQRSISGRDKSKVSPSPAETSESECSSPSPIIFLDEEGYQKSLRAKLSLPTIPVGKDDVEDSDSELSEFFDSFDRFDELDPSLEDNFQASNKPVLATPPKKRKNANVSVSTVCMNPQKFKFDRPTLSASIKKPTPRKLESPFSSKADAPETPWPAKKCPEDSGSLFSPIRSSAFSPPGISTVTECYLQTGSPNNDAFSNYANRLCADMFGSVLNPMQPPDLTEIEQEKRLKLKRKSHNKDSERKLKTKNKSVKGGIQKFASDLVEKSFGSAFKDLQRGVSTCTSALCHLATRLTSYVFQMAFYEIGRRQAFSIKKRAINGLANLMVSEVITSALQELRYIKKQIITNAVTRFASDLAEELVFEGIMEVCQFSHPPTPTATSACRSFDYEDAVVSSYAKDLSESVIQEAFIELSQVNVTFTTEAAISVSMDNLKYVESESMNRLTQSSHNSSENHFASAAPLESKKDFTVKYALFFTSGLVSSVPVPVAAKVLNPSLVSIDHDQTDMSARAKYFNITENCNLSRKGIELLPEKAIVSSSNNGVSSSLQEQRYLDFLKEDDSGVKTFSGSMVDMIVSEAYDVIRSSRTVEDYAEIMVKRMIETPVQVSLEFGSSQQYLSSIKQQSGKFAQSSRCCIGKSNLDISANVPCQNTSRCSQLEHSFFTPCFISDQSAGVTGEGWTTSHINSFSPAMCSCDSLFTDRHFQKDSCLTLLPGTPPPTPLASFDLSPERSMKKLGKKLKGQLAKEFSPATPPSTPHLSICEHDHTKKEDFMLKLMRSLSEEVESSSSDDGSEEFELSEETAKYAEYLSSNIISVATDMAAFSLADDPAQQPTVKHRSQLSVLSDKWGYPAYMINITEDVLETLCAYANCVAGEVISDAKVVLGSRKNSACDLDNGNFQISSCRVKERDYKNFKCLDSTLLLPCHKEGSGLTSKYPSCESVTEEYADHLIRVLRMEGGSSELILDQYASRLAYRAIKSGLQEASKTVKLKSKKIVPRVKPNATSSKDILRLLGRSHHASRESRRQSSIIFPSFREDFTQKTEFTGLLRFAESLANSITCDVRQRLKMSTATLPKSLTDSCLYTKSRNDFITGEIVKTSFPKTTKLFPHKQKLYHSTGSLNSNGLSESIIQAIEHYACKVVDSTLELSLERARLQALENRRKADKALNAGKRVHSYGATCKLCSAKEQHVGPLLPCQYLPGSDASRKSKQCSKSRQAAGHKSKLFHLNIPKIQIDLDKRALFADKIVTAAIEKAERELSTSSLAGDSGIGHDGISFAESLTTEILMSAVKNISQAVNISSFGKDGFQSVDSMTSQHTSVSVGEDSTGSWSNLSFEDEHQDESSSFLHLSDSNGNSSSWSSLGLEGDLCEENLSFPPSDSDGTEEKDEDHKITAEGQELCKILLIRNLDMGPSTTETQLRTILQWIAASEFDISELCFPDNTMKDLLPLCRRIQERGWKTGDLLQAVLQYCEISEGSSGVPKSLFGWLWEKD
ncbi:A-kinase anchor protein 11 [Gastrophryne carolinensis]